MRPSFLAILLLVLCSTAAHAQRGDVLSPFDDPPAGLDSYEFGEARRQQQINQQLSVNNALDWRRSAPPISVGAYAPSVDYYYVERRRGLFGRTRQRVYYGGTEYLAPRPYAAAGVDLPPTPPRAPQSIGRQEVQTGPNRWESRPIYEEDVRPAQAEIITPAPVEALRPSPTAREF